MIPLFDLKMSKSTKNALTRSGDYSEIIEIIEIILNVLAVNLLSDMCCVI